MSQSALLGTSSSSKGKLESCTGKGKGAVKYAGFTAHFGIPSPQNFSDKISWWKSSNVKILLVLEFSTIDFTTSK